MNDDSGMVMFVISVSAPTFRMVDARAKTLARATLRAARAAEQLAALESGT